MSQESAEQAERLRRRLTELQASVAAERRRHVAELERVEKTLAGQGIYLTNDESMSLASPQRLIWAIDHRAPLLASEIRPQAPFNASLPPNTSYFSNVTREPSVSTGSPSDNASTHPTHFAPHNDFAPRDEEY